MTYNQYVMPIAEFCKPINEALMTLPETINVLAEPGRFIVAAAMTSVASVMGQAERDGELDVGGGRVAAANGHGDPQRHSRRGPGSDGGLRTPRGGGSGEPL